MAFDLWTHQFCLACDKQVQTDGAAYCSESCRLADFERTPSTPSTQSGSLDFTPSSCPWTSTMTSTSHSRSKFYLSPAYDFSNAQPYGTTTAQQLFASDYSLFGSAQSSSSTPSSHNLTPSSSHSSLCSIRSTSSSGEAGQLSAKSRKELQAYAVSFEQVRLQRRRSY